MHREIARLENIHRYLQPDKVKMEEKNILEKEVRRLEHQSQNIQTYIQSEIELIIGILKDHLFIEQKDDEVYILTEKGSFAANIQELHCLAPSLVLQCPMISV